MYTCKHFKIEELVSKAVFRRYGQNAWWFFDPRILMVEDRLRGRFGPAVVNDWLWGGKFQHRGLRTPIDIEAPAGDFSFHRLGMALDSHYLKRSVQEVRKYIIDNPDEYPEIKGLELDVNWLHKDVRNASRLITF